MNLERQFQEYHNRQHDMITERQPVVYIHRIPKTQWDLCKTLEDAWLSHDPQNISSLH
jgi:hypothetical protein